MKIAYINKKQKQPSFVFALFCLAIATTIMSYAMPQRNTAKIDKKYTYSATLNEWGQKFNSLDTVKMAISNSDIPSRTANYVIGIINKIQTDIAAQINPQIEADKKLNDSTGKKPKQ